MSKRIDGCSTLESLIVLSLATSKSGGEFVNLREPRTTELAAGIRAFAVAIVFVFQAIVKQREREVEMGWERSGERGPWEDEGKRAGQLAVVSCYFWRWPA